MINIEHNIASVGFLDNKQAQGAYSGIITSLIFWTSTAVKKCNHFGKMFPKIILTCVAGGQIQIGTCHLFGKHVLIFFSGEHFLAKTLTVFEP